MRRNGGRRERPAAARRAESHEPSRIRELQQELAASREYLQSIIQDLEATNEELQSANEEILSSNEELQSTNEELDTAKEELQSTNEEINTVNEELQSRNEELSRANGDLINLLAGVQIAIVFVTNDLRIRRFTPMAEKALNLIPADVGRPIGNIRPNIDCSDLEELIHDAIDNVTVREREVQDRAGNWVLLRIRPYKNVDNRIDGAVLVLLDIDALRKHEQRSKEAENLAEAILDSVTQPLLVLDGELRVAVANPAFAKTFAVSSGQVEGKRLTEISGGCWDIPELGARIADATRNDARPGAVEVTRDFPGAGTKRILVNARKISVGDRRPSMIVLAIEELPRA
jgi:two-component system CheB/CheR fusion protein